jgi:hypothetical protein
LGNFCHWSKCGPKKTIARFAKNRPIWSLWLSVKAGIKTAEAKSLHSHYLSFSASSRSDGQSQFSHSPNASFFILLGRRKKEEEEEPR